MADRGKTYIPDPALARVLEETNVGQPIAMKLALMLLAVLMCSCGGGGLAPAPTPAPAPTITSVSASCNPESVPAEQTSQCTATVAGTGSYSSAVTWSASAGTISSNGLYTAPGTVPNLATVTVTAQSTEDTTKSGTTTLTITVPVTITSVSVACSPSTLPVNQTSTCAATVQGTGAYDPAVTWSATDGTITSSGVFTPTSSGTATITATSQQDTTKSGIAQITVFTPQTVNIVGTWQMLWTSTENPGNFLILEANFSQQSSDSFASSVPNTIVIPAVSSAEGSTPISYQGTPLVLFALGTPCGSAYANSVNMESVSVTFSSSTQASFSVTSNEPGGDEPQGVYATGTLTFDASGETATGQYSINGTGCIPNPDSGSISASMVPEFAGNYTLPSNPNIGNGPPPR